MAIEIQLTREVTRTECHWLTEDIPAGEIFWTFDGETYGCISPTGIAVSRELDEYPFFEIPRTAIRRVYE